MKRHKWSIDVVNTLGRLAGEMDSCAAINAMMRDSEREYFKKKLLEIREEFYNKIGK